MQLQFETTTVYITESTGPGFANVTMLIQVAPTRSGEPAQKRLVKKAQQSEITRRRAITLC